MDYQIPESQIMSLFGRLINLSHLNPQEKRIWINYIEERFRVRLNMNHSASISYKLAKYIEKHGILVDKNITDITNIRFNFIYHLLDDIINFYLSGHKDDYYQICTAKSIFDFIFTNKELKNLYLIYKSEWIYKTLKEHISLNNYKYQKHLEPYMTKYDHYKNQILLF